MKPITEKQARQMVAQHQPTWEVVSSLGSGGFGHVLKIKDSLALSSERMFFALKIFHPNPKVKAIEFVKTVMHEARIHYALMQKMPDKMLGIVEIRSAMLIQGHPAIMMEYMEKGSLATHIQKSTLSFAQKIAIFTKVCRIVGHLHKNKIIHRDIKPDNILLTEDLEPRLSDFGLARQLGQRKSDSWLGGDMRYIAPETIAGKPQDIKADVYSLGITGFELFTGHNPIARLGGYLPRYFGLIDARIAFTDEAIDQFAKEKWPDVLQETLIAAVQPKPIHRTIRAIEMCERLKDASKAAYLTFRGKQSNRDIVAKGYLGPVSFRVEEGRPVFLVDEDLRIVSWFQVGKVKKARGKSQYQIEAMKGKIHNLKQAIKLNRVTCSSFNLKAKNNPKDILKQLVFLKTIDHDAVEKLLN